MKIGIITFHWATNYGAVLQAYALSAYINSVGCDAEIINYYPRRYKKNIINAIVTRKPVLIPQRIREVLKDKKIDNFRKKYLRITKYFESNDKLKNANFNFDCYICGSDQIWNESFLCRGERKKTYTYFLNFAPTEKIIASYAASFGVTEYKEELKDDIRNNLKRFDFVSVREETGLRILQDIGISNACVVPDPTLLLQKKDYEKFIYPNKQQVEYAFVYMLHGRRKDADELIKSVRTKQMNIIDCEDVSLEEWLSKIYYAKHVITNSFHGIVFSIIFEKPFTAILIEGSGMNDRIITLLGKLGLSERIYNGNDKINENDINWNIVEQRLDAYRRVGYDYIEKILKCEKGKEDED